MPGKYEAVLDNGTHERFDNLSAFWDRHAGKMDVRSIYSHASKTYISEDDLADSLLLTTKISASHAKTYAAVAASKKKRATATGRARDYCRICKGPHVYKHGRA